MSPRPRRSPPPRGASAAGALWCACALLLCAALAAAAQERESQLAQAPFVLGSRFGRSSPRLLLPRNDKFFFSSRYGKRSPPALEVPPGPPTPPAPPTPQLFCEYLGVRSLYRCQTTNRYHDIRRLDDSSPEE